jgi:hypothetical protein
MMHLLLSIIAFQVFPFGEIPEKYRGFTVEEIKKLEDEVKLTQSSPDRSRNRIKKGNDNKRVKKLEREIKRLKSISNFNPTFGTTYSDIPTLSRFYGTLDGNIISLGATVRFKIKLDQSNSFPPDSYLACSGQQIIAKYNYRIIGECDTLITPDHEYRVNVNYKDTKKVDGLEADIVHTGEEESLLGEIVTGISTALLDVEKDRVQTDFGFATVPNGKNAILNGLIGGAGAANNTLRQHTNQKSVVMAIKDKTPVIVEFNRRFQYEVN